MQITQNPQLVCLEALYHDNEHESPIPTIPNFLWLELFSTLAYFWLNSGSLMGRQLLPFEMFEKLGVLTCNLVPHMLPFEVKFVLQNYVFLGSKKIGIGEGAWPNPPAYDRCAHTYTTLQTRRENHRDDRLRQSPVMHKLHVRWLCLSAWPIIPNKTNEIRQRKHNFNFIRSPSQCFVLS